MAKTDSRVDEFISRAKRWQPELVKLRSLVLESGLVEELKWRQPCYTFDGANVVILGGFKEYVALMFFKGVLISDSSALLVAAGENSQSARQMRFTSVDEIEARKSDIAAYLADAIEVERAGLKVKFKTISEHKRPDELETRFKESPELKKSFEKLTPGRQREYLLHFAQPKQSKTRISRIAKCEQRILDGKGLRD